MSTILHIDMDAFYASVEERDDPSLKGKPVIVGGKARRGVVCAASYAARKFGVHSAMPMMRAMNLCPQAIVVSPRMDRYSEISSQIFSIFHRFTPLVEGLSIDEAFLDVGASESLFGNGETIARRIKKEIKDELGLPASAGVAPNKFIAKIASDFGKPDGLLVVEKEDVVKFLAPLPIERMWGVGPKTAPKIHALGLHTFGDIARAETHVLQELIGTWGVEIRALARGEDFREVNPGREAKSISAESTFENDLIGRDAIESTLLAHAAKIAQRLLAENFEARTITVKLKYGDFSLVTRRITTDDPMSDTTSIYAAACALLDKCDLRRGVRLTGVGVSNLEERGGVRGLFVDPRAKKFEKLEEVVAKAEARFGSGALERARLVDSTKPTATIPDAQKEPALSVLKNRR
jgi:DNA polymerase IV